jgi:hypothetical protein
MPMLSKAIATAVALAASSLVVGVGPADAQMTITTLIMNIPLAPATVGLNVPGFNPANFASVWAMAPTGSIPQLTDVRLFINSTLSESFTATNTDTTQTLNVSSSAVTFKKIANNKNSYDQTTTNAITSG